MNINVYIHINRNLNVNNNFLKTLHKCHTYPALI